MPAGGHLGASRRGSLGTLSKGIVVSSLLK